MKKQYEMPNLYVVAFTGEVDTATCSENGLNVGKGASTYGLTPCGDPGGDFGPISDPSTGNGDSGLIQ